MVIRRADWLVDVLLAAGVKVYVHSGWQARGAGEYLDLTHVVWHHDASAVGYSPAMATYIKGQVDQGRAGANIWVTLDGTWHIIAGEVTYHAGNVLPGKPGNRNSLGIETDHTTGETWSGVELLQSLRVGTAAILKHLGKTSNNLEFHKTICEPVGRKSDPDGLSLTTERGAVGSLMVPPAPIPSQEDDMILILSNAQPAYGRIPFYELRKHDADTFLVVSHNGAKLARVDGTTTSGLWYYKQEGATGNALGIEEWNGRAIVCCAGSGTYQVSP